jgi:hypothetical protein
MKTELRTAPHTIVEGAVVVEIWHDGQFIGQVVGADGPGVRVISKHPMLPQWHADQVTKMVEIKIVPAQGREVEFPPSR